MQFSLGFLILQSFMLPKSCMLLNILLFEMVYFYDESFKFLESSLRLTLKMASDVGDPDALDGFICPG
jgi:hypothetical protein